MVNAVDRMMGDPCAACPVDVGECPRCGTFWWHHHGKRQGMRPTTARDATAARAAWDKWGGEVPNFNALPNAILAPGDQRLTPHGWT